MSDTPSAPFLMRFSTKVREILTPNQNILYLGIESVILSLLVAGVFYSYIGVTNIFYLLPATGFLLIFLTRVVLIQPDKWKREQYTMEFGLKHIIFSLVISLAPSGVIYYQYGQVDTIILSVLVLFLYSISLYTRSKKYLGEPKFFTDNYSNVRQQWYMSAIAREKAIQQYDRGNNFRAHYWASRAVSYYDEIVEKEERLTLREAASEFSAGCQLLMASIFSEGNESYSYYSASEESFNRGRASLSERICDNCGRRRKIDRCKRIVDDEKRYVYCDTCQKTGQDSRQTQSTQDRRKRNRNKTGGSNSKQKSRNTSQTSSSRGSQNNSNQDSRSKSKKGQKSHADKSDLMSKKDALSILEIKKDNPSDEDVHEAFRKRVKESHPDTGGSEEEFKKVKKARERLVSD